MEKIVDFVYSWIIELLDRQLRWDRLHYCISGSPRDFLFYERSMATHGVDARHETPSSVEC